jgi:hypothetical protein
MKTNQSEISDLRAWSTSLVQNLAVSLMLDNVQAGDALQRELLTELRTVFEETRELLQEDILTADECHYRLDTSVRFLFQQAAMRDEFMDSVQNPFELFVFFSDLSKTASEVLKEHL